jgi:two-component system sensor histidine kinase/response regulator
VGAPVSSRIGVKLMVLIVVPLTVLLLLAWIVLWQTGVRTGADDATRLSSQRLRATTTALLTLIDSETGMRGYVMTGRSLFAEPYRRSTGQVQPNLRRLEMLARDSPPAQRAQVAQIAIYATEAMRFVDRYVALADAGHRSVAMRDVADGDAKRAMDRFRAAMAVYQAGEIVRRDYAFAKAANRWQSSYKILVVGVLLAVLTTIALYLTISRNIVARLVRVKADALAIAAGEAPGAPQAGNDEVAAVDRAFRYSAKLLHEREGSLARYRLLSENARDIILFIGADGRLIEVNAAAADIYGYKREEMKKMALSDLVVRDAEDSRAIIAQARKAGSLAFESRHRHSSGTTFPVDVAVSSSMIDGEQVLLAIVRDITERLAAVEVVKVAFARAVEASRLKSQFVATLSHEIRTPMNAIIGMNELLLDTELDAEQREFTETVRDSVHALLVIINDVLDFSKIESGKLELEALDLNISATVESAARLLGQQAQYKGLSLMTYIESKAQRIVLGDTGRLRQVLVNLIGNSVKFSERGSIVVSATLEAEDALSCAIRFSVKDTGIGIAAETIEELFEPFRQGDGSTTRKYGGTGLGLAISRELVSLMGGAIEVDSTPGVGSTFSFVAKFPRAVNEFALPTYSLNGVRALIVDDDPVCRRIFHHYLVSWGLLCDTAKDATEALVVLREQALAGAPYALAIVDYAMPDFNGVELAEQIRADTLLLNTQLILVTGHDSPGLGKGAIAAGFSSYMTKPIRQSQLFECIARTVDTSRPAKRPAPPKAEQTVVRSQRVLLVEDQPVNQRLATLQLGKLGFASVAVCNGEEALAALLEGEFAIILMDCQMPVMDGFATTRAIRQSEVHTGRHVTIAAMTANARPEDQLACLDAGMDDYLAKPVQLEQLRALLDRWVPALVPT